VTAKKSQRACRTAQLRVSLRKKNLLAGLGLSAVDYKDTAALRMFISERGKIRSRHVTGLTVQQQRQVSAAIKNAREMALLPYPGQTAER
jgi:small subunit ribosomal protein S18